MHALASTTAAPNQQLLPLLLQQHLLTFTPAAAVAPSCLACGFPLLSLWRTVVTTGAVAGMNPSVTHGSNRASSLPVSNVVTVAPNRQ